MAEKRTLVRRPPWMGNHWVPEDAVVEVGPRLAQYSDEPAPKGANARREVYLDGEKVGDIRQVTRRASRPIHKGASIVRVTGHPTEWAIDNRAFGARYAQMNEASFRLVQRVLEQRRKDAEA